MPSYSSNDGISGRYGLSSDLDQTFALLPVEEEGLGVSAQRDEAFEARTSEVSVISLLRYQVELVSIFVKEGDAGDITARFWDRIAVFSCWPDSISAGRDV